VMACIYICIGYKNRNCRGKMGPVGTGRRRPARASWKSSLVLSFKKEH
jgi:hypothetical protein